MSARPIVEVQEVGKRYLLGATGDGSLRNTAERLMRRFRGQPESAQKSGEFWSLRDISFSVQPGEVIGLVGRNGAGKSTLLKILSRITEPTTGRIKLRGRVASLLEVGTGFHPELTGRENIFLNGAILGMKRWEIVSKFDEIVEFSEVGAFLDTPVKRYSSGMFVRLAFAVAAHLEPEILLIDEVLAVGDAAFQKKCLGKMDEVATQRGRTVFFVSHNLGAVRALCTSALLLEKGQLTLLGTTDEVIAKYLAGALPNDGETNGHIQWPNDATAPGNEEMRLRLVALKTDDGVAASSFDASQPITVEVHYTVKQRLRNTRIFAFIYTAEGENAFGMTDHLSQPETLEPGQYRSVFQIPGTILNRRGYLLSIGCDVPGERTIIPEREYLRFTVCGTGNQACLYPEKWPGVVCPRVPSIVERIGE